MEPTFDAVDYFNSTLPPLQTSLSRTASGQGSAVPLAELSAQAQTSVSQLGAHTTRLTTVLTQLTDDILRSGSRLAYEVELLRGETLGLAEALADGLQVDIERFVPGGIVKTGPDGKPALQTTAGAAAEAGGHSRRASMVTPPAPPPAPEPAEPEYISQLRTLTLVRSRLDAVIQTFGAALEFVFPPSEVSVSSSFLSVSAPDPGARGSESHSIEEKGQQVLQKYRDEIATLLSNSADPIKGVEDAAERLEQLKDLNVVWRGTAEEKGRTKFLEGLAKMVEDRHRDLVREMESSKRDISTRSTDLASASRRARNGDADMTSADNKGYGGYGLISQLQKLRGGL
jgi:hypothetical protein